MNDVARWTEYAFDDARRLAYWRTQPGDYAGNIARTLEDVIRAAANRIIHAQS